MNKGIYIATLEPNSGKSIISLGLMQHLLGKTAKVAYFRPVIDVLPNDKPDKHIDTVLKHFKLEQTYKDSYAITRNQLINNRNSGNIGKSLDIIIQKYKELEEKNDFVLVEGTDFSGESSVFEFDWNVNITKNLGLPTILISHGVGKSLDEFIGSLQMAYKTFKNDDVEVLGLVANKIQAENAEIVKDAMHKFLPKSVEVYTIPLIKKLANPTIKEITEAIDGKVIIGKEFMDNQTGSFAVGAMQLRNFLTHLKDDCLVISPGDRSDLILGVLQANISSNYPKIAGMVLTGGLVPEEPILNLMDGLSHVVPIISVKKGTYEITNTVGNIKSEIYSDNISKIQASLASFQKHIPIDDLLENLTKFENNIITPSMFQYNLVKRARKSMKRIVLPESNDERILRAASRLSHLNLVKIILLGEPDKIRQRFSNFGLNPNEEMISLINPLDFDKFDDYAQTFYELRKHKDVNLGMARDMMKDVSYFGTMMIYKGDADGMVSGAAHTTQHTIRPALQFIKTKPSSKIVSSVFFMCLDDRVAVFGDCAINPNPNAEQLAEIAIASADSSMAFGIEPRIAMLSYSSGASGKGADVDKVRKATEIVKEKRPDLMIEGPIQYDAAVDYKVGKSKLPDSQVAGRASVLIFPDLNTGNNTYKAVQRETDALAIGPMLQGLNKPVNDLSRGCTVEDIFNTVILTSIQAQGI